MIGNNFGNKSNVKVDGRPCSIISQEYVINDDVRNPLNSDIDITVTKLPDMTTYDRIVCLLPPLSAGSIGGTKIVHVENAMYPSGLYHDLSYLSYRIPPSKPLQPPLVANLGATRIDLIWLVSCVYYYM